MLARYALAITYCSLAAASLAQPTLTSSNVPAPGSEFALLTCDGYQQVGPVGANVDYEYWGMLLPNTGNRPSRWFSASSTPTGALIPSATLISTDGGSDTLFWAVTSNGLEQVGSRATDEGNNPVSYTDAILELKLPCTFGTVWSDATSATINTPFGQATRIGTIQGIGDGYGTLRMPSNQQIPNVLRVKVRRDFNDQTLLGTVRRIRNTRYFYAEASVYPILRLQEDSVQISGGGWGVTRRAEWQGNGFTVSVDEFDQAAVAFTAYPNPATGLVTLSMAAPVVGEAQVLDATGRGVLLLRLSSDKAALDVSDLAPGAYSLRIMDALGRSLGVQRLIVE
jgi:hypothetical protein